jgi:gamma-glutamyl:cysteine ligase YbdK (ATP-grasp superfamily)
MGLPVEQTEFDDADRERFAARLGQNLQALQSLLERPGFGVGPATLGAELELSLVDRQGIALPMNRTLLTETGDPQLQLELDRFNLEYNLTPVRLAGNPFGLIEAEMEQATEALDRAAGAHGGRVVQIGILPTLRPADLESHAMTDLPRYHALSAAIRRIKPGGFEVSINGLDPLTHTCSDVTLEGANTSLQLHLRVPPEDFAATYNAAQMATAPALAVAANSPIFLGHRLWDETRVALFKQTVDERSPELREWRPPSRVSFGRGWVGQGAYELFAEAVAQFPPLLPITGAEDPVAMLHDGVLPRLDELRLQQGTVWRWNRPVYDPEAGGHLRIELRALPSGPTPRDMAASAAFLIGLTLGLRDDMSHLIPAFPFDCAEYNFYRAAQRGLDAQLLWPSPQPPSPREVDARVLVERLLPVAQRGLAGAGVSDEESGRLLDIVRGRIESDTTGARWQRRALARHERGASRAESLHAMLEDYVQGSRSRRPVHEWTTGP